MSRSIKKLKNIEVVNQYGEYLVKHGRPAYTMKEAKALFNEILKRMIPEQEKAYL